MTPAQLVPTATAPPNATAGPSTLRPKRKPTAPHPSTSSHNASRKRRKLPPPLPITASIMEPAAKPGGSKTLPIKTLQGVGTKRTDTPRRAGPLGREVVLVTRKMGVGAYLGRCRSLICDEGYTHIVLHAIGAAIPQALVLLHALLEVLPYPRHPRGVWYEIFTGRVACTDEEQAEADAEADTAEAGKEGAKVKSWLKNIGSVEASETIIKERIASSIQIHIHVGPKSEAVLQAPKAKPEPITSAAPLTVKKRNRPGKQKRQAMARLKDEAGKNGEGEMEVDEEAAMNFMPASSPEEVEMIEG